MEVDTCYTTMPLSGRNEGPSTPPRMTRRRDHRLNVRSQRRRHHSTTTTTTDNDFEQASDFLHHFHAITSRSLDVIHETIGAEGAQDLMSSEFHNPSALGPPNMRRTKTCSCLLEAQNSGNMGDHHDWFSAEQTKQDDEDWGFYSEDIEPLWSASTLRHNFAYFRR